LYEAPGIQLYSLQVGDRAKDARAVNPAVIDLSGKIRDFSDTAALMLQMDAVVTVCTSSAHLAGSLGVPVHVVLPRHGQHFVWGYSSDETPWYPSARLYRQDQIGEWLPVMKRVAEALK
jgi:ADP-heptose:LPS heptosyltransferase